MMLAPASTAGAVLRQVPQEQRHVLGAELPDPAGSQRGHQVLAHRPGPHLQGAGGQRAAAVPQPLFSEYVDGEVPTAGGQAVLGDGVGLASRHVCADAASHQTDARAWAPQKSEPMPPRNDGPPPFGVRRLARRGGERA